MKRASELERQLVGALMALENPEKLLQAAGLNAEDFSDEQLRICWSIGSELVKRGDKINAMPLFSACRVANKMKDDDLGWFIGLESQNVLDAAGFVAVARDLRRQARTTVIAGKLADMSRSIIQDNDFLKHHSEFRSLSEEYTGLHAEGRRGSASIIAAFESYERRKLEGKVRLVQTGLDVLDEKTGGLPPKLCVFYGEPGIGKSALLSTILEQQLRAGLVVVFFSFEDGDEWFVKRQMARRLGMRFRDVFNKDFTDGEKTAEVAQEMTTLYENLWVITKREAKTAQDVVRISSQYVNRHGANVVYLDNMTSVEHEARGKFEDLRVRVGRSYSDFANFADSYRIPFVALAHTTRKYVERTGGKAPPVISDIAETADVDRYTRFALGLWKKKTNFRVTVTKHNEGDTGTTMEFEMHKDAALVDHDSGRVVDIDGEAREERKEREARSLESSVAKALNRASMMAKSKPKKEDAEPKAEAAPPVVVPPPQPDLFPDFE